MFVFNPFSVFNFVCVHVYTCVCGAHNTTQEFLLTCINKTAVMQQ